MTAAAVIRRRLVERTSLLDEARAFAAQIDPDVDLRAVAVFGSVARGDFNERSDIDVLVLADALAADPLARLGQLGADVAPRVSVVAWTVTEWQRQRARRNPIAREAQQVGVWLIGSPPESN